MRGMVSRRGVGLHNERYSFAEGEGRHSKETVPRSPESTDLSEKFQLQKFAFNGSSKLWASSGYER